mgnify:CR=1 FL=1
MASFHIIGDEDTVLGFSFAGVEATAVDSAEPAREKFQQLVTQKTTRILIITRKVAGMLGDALVEHRLTATPPYVVELDDVWGTPTRRPGLERMIHEAVGIRIVGEDQEESG